MDKIAINSAAVRDPALIGKIAGRFGSQAVVVAIDAEKSTEVLKYSLLADARPPGGMRFNGRGKRRLAERARSC